MSKQNVRTSSSKLSALLLRKNLSPARVVGFVISTFIGMAIVMAGVQFYFDASPLWEDDDSFIKKDYLVVNKHVTSENTLGDAAAFSESELTDLEKQPWVRSVGRFHSADFRVSAAVRQGGQGMTTAMFFESIPDEYVDVAGSAWRWREGSREIPVIISKDYLTLYNFGFATSAGLPQMTEQLMGSVPLELRISSDEGSREETFAGRVVGFSNRLNTILVPDDFMTWANESFGSEEKSKSERVSRVIIDVSAPGDVAINEYLDENEMEVAGDKSASQAAYLLRVVTGIIMAIGIVITLLSFFILLLSVSLLMEKSRDKLHTLLLLGYPLRTVGAPYRDLITWATIGSFLLSVIAVFLLRATYIGAIGGLTGAESPFASLWQAPLAGLIISLIIINFGLTAVNRRVARAWR